MKDQNKNLEFFDLNQDAFQLFRFSFHAATTQPEKLGVKPFKSKVAKAEGS